MEWIFGHEGKVFGQTNPEQSLTFPNSYRKPLNSLRTVLEQQIKK